MREDLGEGISTVVGALAPPEDKKKKREKSNGKPDGIVLDEADRIKSLLMNEYVKVLGVEYRDSILKKIDYIVRQFQAKRVYVPEEVFEKSSRSR